MFVLTLSLNCMMLPLVNTGEMADNGGKQIRQAASSFKLKVWATSAFTTLNEQIEKDSEELSRYNNVHRQHNEHA